MGDSVGSVPAETIDKTVVAHNRIRDVKWALGHAYGQHESKAEFRDNGADVPLSWDVNRPRPGPNRKVTGSAPVAAAAARARTETYLSDVRWTRAVNGWGRVELDRSNGEKAHRDGEVITIAGRRYKKGLGVARNSAITYKLDGNQSTFASDVGIDDEVGDNKGSMRFVVFADGRKIYDSRTLTGKSKLKRLKLDIAGVKELKLVTTDAGDGGGGDHGSWGGARIA
jgi:hypothetical protein